MIDTGSIIIHWAQKHFVVYICGFTQLSNLEIYYKALLSPCKIISGVIAKRVVPNRENGKPVQSR